MLKGVISLVAKRKKTKHHEGIGTVPYCSAAAPYSCQKFSPACTQWKPEQNGNSCCPTEMQSHLLLEPPVFDIHRLVASLIRVFV